ncbi:MAG TPA: acyl-CoA carboxylase subunit beta [Elusimicrobiota bacterium]|nr:acyl-CoA carboxylase subunit beta [Elusimicrobiota bacterium]
MADPAKPSVSPKTQDLLKRREKAEAGGGPERAKAQHQRGKLLARERIDLLLDEDSFEEIDLLAGKNRPELGPEDGEAPADGVVAGHGKINGRGVCVFAQDFTVAGGSLGLAHARKISKLLDLAMEAGVPVVGLCDSGGARIQEGVDALGGYAEIFHRNVRASGVIPQISVVLGPCAGGAVYSPALTDFVFMVEGTGHMFITGPDVIRQATGEQCDFETLGGARTHSEKSGVCHFRAASEQDCFRQIRELLDYLPSNWKQPAPSVMLSDDAARPSDFLDSISNADSKKPYDIKAVIGEIADGHRFFEVHRDFAKNIVVGFVRLGGESAGVIANNPAVLSGALDIDASEKAGRFVRFCDAFGIPLLTLVDVPGYWPGLAQEHGGIIRKGAKLLYAYAEATVPKITVILRKAYGGAYDVMSSKHIRGDVNYAWPGAEIAVMGAAGAVEIIYRREIAGAADPEAKRRELIESYIERFASPYQAAKRGYVDEIIEASQTRRKVVTALRFLKSKAAQAPAKKHGNIPL